MELKAQGKYIDTSLIERIFTQGEAYADKLIFIVDAVNNGVDVSGCTFVMRTVAIDGSMTETVLEKSVQDESVHLTWHVPDTVTAIAGMLQLELIGSQDAQLIIKYKMRAVFVKEAVFGENVPAPDVVEEKLAQMNELIEEARNLVTLDATLTIEGRAADAKAVGDAIGVVNVAVETVAEELRNMQASDGSIQEVIDARAGYFSDYTYSSLQQRLNAELGACVRQNALELALSNVTIAYQEADAELTDNYIALRDRVGQHDTRVDALESEIAIARKNYSGIEWSDLAGRLGSDFGAVWLMFGEHSERESVNAASIGMQKKNLLKYQHTDATTGFTRNGITVTPNAYGGIDIYGTATSDTNLDIYLTGDWQSSDVIYKKDRYRIYLNHDTGEIVTAAVLQYDGSTQTVERLSTATSADKEIDMFITGIYLSITLTAGTMYNGTIKPMLTYADITDNIFEPYTPSLQEQINELRSQIAAMTAATMTNETEE